MEKRIDTDILVLGCSSVGKTLLVRQLCRQCKHAAKTKEEATENMDVTTTRTTGMEIDTLAWKSRALLIKEVGSDMRSMWPRYFTKCRSITYVVDVSNPSQVAASAIEFLRILAHANVVGKPVFLVVNKMDTVHSMTLQMFSDLICLDELMSSCKSKLSAHRVSALDGTNVSKLLNAYVEVLS